MVYLQDSIKIYKGIICFSIFSTENKLLIHNNINESEKHMLQKHVKQNKKRVHNVLLSLYKFQEQTKIYCAITENIICFGGGNWSEKDTKQLSALIEMSSSSLGE